uniref:PHD-type domain-containing protein n=1 Tax=Anopheles farauti TaxID=69004 RepID=A0A182QK01_9DIPT
MESDRMPAEFYDEDGFRLAFENDTESEEKQYFMRAFPNVSKIAERRIHCTSCNVHIGTAPVSEAIIRMHPVLRVTHCRSCHAFYNSGEFDKGEDGSELYCRWCGQGGEVYCCSKCPYVFCKSCIVRNLSRACVQDIVRNENWHCFSCAPRIMWHLRAQHWALENFIEKQKKAIKNQQLSSNTISALMKQDSTSCCPGKGIHRWKGNTAAGGATPQAAPSPASTAPAAGAKKTGTKRPYTVGTTPDTPLAQPVVSIPPLKHSILGELDLSGELLLSSATKSVSSPAAASASGTSSRNALTNALKKQTKMAPKPASEMKRQSPQSVPPAKKKRLGNNEVVCTPDIMSMFTGGEEGAAGAGTSQTRPAIVTVGAKTPGTVTAASLASLPGGTAAGAPPPKNGGPKPKAILHQSMPRNLAVSVTTNRMAGAATTLDQEPMLQTVRVSSTTPRQANANTPVYHTIGGYRIDLHTASQQGTYRLPNGKLIQVRKQTSDAGRGDSAPGDATATGEPSSQVQFAISAAVQPSSVVPISTIAGVAQQPNAGGHGQQPILNLLRGLVNGPHTDSALGNARKDFEAKLLAGVEICHHIIGKIYSLTNSNSFKNIRNLRDLKELFIHLSYLLTYGIGRFKTLQERCVEDVKKMGFTKPSDFVMMGEKINNRNPEDDNSDDDDDCEIIEQNTTVIEVDSDEEAAAAASRVEEAVRAEKEAADSAPVALDEAAPSTVPPSAPVTQCEGSMTLTVGQITVAWKVAGVVDQEQTGPAAGDAAENVTEGDESNTEPGKSVPAATDGDVVEVIEMMDENDSATTDQDELLELNVDELLAKNDVNQAAEAASSGNALNESGKDEVELIEISDKEVSELLDIHATDNNVLLANVALKTVSNQKEPATDKMEMDDVPQKDTVTKGLSMSEHEENSCTDASKASDVMKQKEKKECTGEKQEEGPVATAVQDMSPQEKGTAVESETNNDVSILDDIEQSSKGSSSEILNLMDAADDSYHSDSSDLQYGTEYLVQDAEEELTKATAAEGSDGTEKSSSDAKPVEVTHDDHLQPAVSQGDSEMVDLTGIETAADKEETASNVGDKERSVVSDGGDVLQDSKEGPEVDTLPKPDEKKSSQEEDVQNVAEKSTDSLQSEQNASPSESRQAVVAEEKSDEAMVADEIPAVKLISEEPSSARVGSSVKVDDSDKAMPSGE